MSDETANVLLSIAALGQLAVLGIAALFAWRQVNEARTAREAQVRPFVGIDLHVEQTIIYLVVTNTGQSMASNVRFRFSPPLDTTMDSLALADLKIFSDGIPSMPPGKRFSTVFDHFPQREGSGLPDVYRVTITYRSDPLNRDYTEDVELDLGIYRNLMHATRRDLHDIHERLKEIQREMHRWTASLGGLLVMSPDDIRKRNEELMEARDARIAERAAQGESEDNEAEGLPSAPGEADE